MNVGEAQNVQALLSYLLDPHALSDVAARDAAVRAQPMHDRVVG